MGKDTDMNDWILIWIIAFPFGCRPVKWQRRWLSYSAFATAFGAYIDVFCEILQPNTDSFHEKPAGSLSLFTIRHSRLCGSSDLDHFIVGLQYIYYSGFIYTPLVFVQLSRMLIQSVQSNESPIFVFFVQCGDWWRPFKMQGIWSGIIRFWNTHAATPWR